MLRFDTGRIVLLHVPDVGVPASLHLLLGLVDCMAEAVVHFFVDAVFVLVPDQIGNVVDRRLQKMAGFPEIHAHFAGLLPTQETETELLVGHRHDPDVRDIL